MQKIKVACSPVVLLMILVPDFHDLLVHSCSLGYFSKHRDRGITILVPDAKRIANLYKLVNAGETDKFLHGIKSLIIPDKIEKLSGLADGFTNENNERIAVAKASDSGIKLANGCEITPLKDLTISRPYFSAFMLKGEADIRGEATAVIAPVAKKVTKGGMMILSDPISPRELVTRKVENLYMNPTPEYIGKSIYFKKVILQWSILESHCPEKFTNGEILNYMGNEEVSDSYLLDMITPSECFEELYACLGGRGHCPQRLQSIGFADYIKKKNEVIAKSTGGWTSTVDPSVQEAILKKISSPLEARNECKIAYSSNMERLGRDLFVMFTNISKEIWLIAREKSLLLNGNDYSRLDNASFKAYRDCVRFLYGCGDITEITRQPFNKEQDFKLYVNVIKSDVFLMVIRQVSQPFTPNPQFAVPQDTHPPEFEKKLYSMNALMYRYSSTGGLVRGGDEEVESLLDKYL